MVNKYEIVGILGSVAIMALALFLLNLDSRTLDTVATSAVTQSAAVVVVADGEEQDQSKLADALLESFDGMDTQQKIVADDVVIGGGKEAIVGTTVRVHYVGRLSNGQEFDSSEKRGEPLEFTLGAGQVIAGWEEGILGMKEGGERTLVIPPQFGYGERGIGPIPGNATLLFSVKLLEVIE